MGREEELRRAIKHILLHHEKLLELGYKTKELYKYIHSPETGDFEKAVNSLTNAWYPEGLTKSVSTAIDVQGCSKVQQSKIGSVCNIF